jgi:hypothetical protein
MTAILISTKFEDVQTIRAQQLIDRAGHGRFPLPHLLAMEYEMLKQIGFRIQPSDSFYQDAMVTFKGILKILPPELPDNAKDILNEA